MKAALLSSCAGAIWPLRCPHPPGLSELSACFAAMFIRVSMQELRVSSWWKAAPGPDRFLPAWLRPRGQAVGPLYHPPTPGTAPGARSRAGRAAALSPGRPHWAPSPRARPAARPFVLRPPTAFRHWRKPSLRKLGILPSPASARFA